MGQPTEFLGRLLEIGIRGYVRLFGRTMARADVPWLLGPVGKPGLSGLALYEAYAAEHGLVVDTRDEDAGLLPDFGALAGPGFAPDRVDTRVQAFYERTARYRLDAWSQWFWPFQPFAWVLISLVSRRIDQINLPLGPLDTSAGMTSEIIRLDGASEATFRGWLRKLSGLDRVIYAGFYTVATPPRFGAPCVKVVFPVPYGSITVLLRPEARRDGSLELVSSGRGFGDAGFYRVLALDGERIKVAYLGAMKESIHVFVDDAGVLRTAHEFRAWYWPMLKLHYKITGGAAEREARETA